MTHRPYVMVLWEKAVVSQEAKPKHEEMMPTRAETGQKIREIKEDLLGQFNFKLLKFAGVFISKNRKIVYLLLCTGVNVEFHTLGILPIQYPSISK